MTNLVLLVTVFVILNGFVHSYPSWSLKQNTNRPKRFVGYNLCPNVNIPSRNYKPVSITQNQTQNTGRLLRYVPCEETFTEKSVSRGSDGAYQDISDEFKGIGNKRESLESKLDLFNKLWRSHSGGSQDLPKLFFLRTNAYKK